MSDDTAVERSMIRINGEAVDGFVATRSGYEAVGHTKEDAIMALDKKIVYEEGGMVS